VNSPLAALCTSGVGHLTEFYLLTVLKEEISRREDFIRVMLATISPEASVFSSAL
jgi:hypothetical protein